MVVYNILRKKRILKTDICQNLYNKERSNYLEYNAFSMIPYIDTVKQYKIKLINVIIMSWQKLANTILIYEI